MAQTRFYPKLPRQPFASPHRGWTHDLQAIRRRIEQAYRAGTTAEPYVQLVAETDDEYCVIAEWLPGRGWTGPLQAAGFAPVPGAWQ